MSMETTTYIIKPEAFSRRDAIKEMISSHNGLDIKKHIVTALTKSDLIYLASIDEGYASNPQLFHAYSHFMRQGLVEVGLIEGTNAINDFRELCGTHPNPRKCLDTSLRSRFGQQDMSSYNSVPFFLNGVHKPESIKEVLFERALWKDVFHRPIEDIFKEMVLRDYEIPPTTVNPAYRHQSMIVWKKHILRVAEFASMLANDLGANQQVVQIASLGHDWTRLENDNKTHHLTSGEKTRELLQQLDYDPLLTEMVCDCIITHRNSTGPDPESLEQKIVCSADGMANIAELSLLWFSAMRKHNLDSRAAVKKVRNKIKRSYAKLMPGAKELIQVIYDANMQYLEGIHQSETLD
jgi:uncharacterized protein